MKKAIPEQAAVPHKKWSPLGVPAEDIRRWEMFLLGMVVGALLLATVQAYTGKGLPPGSQTNQPAGMPAAGDPLAPAPTEAPVDLSKLDIRPANAKGPNTAPITIVEFSDFQCPFCLHAHETTNQQIWDLYVTEGKVRFVYKHYAILGEESTWAAQASECAADQGRFWEYHDELFRQAKITAAENVGAFTKDNLIKFAEGLDLDLARFTPCLENDETLVRVEADGIEGQEFQVSATPTFFINNIRMMGAQPWQQFEALITAALNP
jgi:protein-disulfide isomerase